MGFNLYPLTLFNSQSDCGGQHGGDRAARSSSRSAVAPSQVRNFATGIGLHEVILKLLAGKRSHRCDHFDREFACLCLVCT